MPRDIEVVGLNPTNYCPVSSSVNPLRTVHIPVPLEDARPFFNAYSGEDIGEAYLKDTL